MFTKSEMAMMSWSSREQSASLEKKNPNKKRVIPKNKRNIDELREEIYGEEQHVETITTEDDEPDIRKMTGKEAWKFFANQGLKFAPVVKR